MTLVFSRASGSSRSSSSLPDVPLEHLEELFCSPARQALFDLEGRLLVHRQSTGGGASASGLGRSEAQRSLPLAVEAEVEAVGQKSNNRSSSSHSRPLHHRLCLCRLRGNLLLIAEVKPGNKVGGGSSSSSSSCDSNNSHHHHQQPPPPQVITAVFGASLALVLLHRFEIKLVEERTAAAATANNANNAPALNAAGLSQSQQYEFILTLNSSSSSKIPSSFAERYHFIAASRAERDQWIQSIYLASFDFLRSIQRALRETLTEEKAKLVVKGGGKSNHFQRFISSHSHHQSHHHHQHLHFLTIKCTTSTFPELRQQHFAIEPLLYVKVFARLRHIERSWSYLARTEAIASRAPLFATRITLPSLSSCSNSSSSSSTSELLPLELKFELIKSADGELDNAFLVAFAYARSGVRRREDTFEVARTSRQGPAAFSVVLLSSDGSSRAVGRLVFTLHQRKHSSLVSRSRPNLIRTSRSLESLLLPSSLAKSSSFEGQHFLRRSTSSLMDTSFRREDGEDLEGSSSSIFSNTLYKRFSFKVPASTANGQVDLLLEEFMSESKFAFSIPQILIKLYAHDEEMIIAAVEALLAETPAVNFTAIGAFFGPLLAFHRRWLAALKDYLGEMIHFMAECSFRPSKNKTEPCLQFVPTNFHKQACRAVVIVASGGLEHSGVQSSSSSASPLYSIFTHGAFSAHHLGYQRHGGMQSIVSGKNESLKVLACWRTLKGRLMVVLHSEGRITASLNSALFLAEEGGLLPLRQLEPIYRSVRALCETLGSLLTAAEVEEQLALLAALESSSLEGSASLVDGVFHLEPLELVCLNIQASLLGIEHKLEEARGRGKETVLLAELESFNRKLKGAIESLRRIVLAVYLSAFSQLQEHKSNKSRENEELALERLRFRHQAVVSQAVTCMVIFIMDRLGDRHFLARAARTGFILVQHEVWLSCFQEEQGMLEDMVYALTESADHLLEVVFIGSKREEELGDQSSAMPTIEVVGEKLRLTFYVAETVMPSVTSSSFECRIKSIIFNIGVNEAATMAERLGYNSFQRQLNRDNFAKLKAFARRFYPEERLGLSELLAELEQELGPKSTSSAKNLRVMQLVEAIVGRLGGIRATCCKSAKDRTGMSVTLQEARYATAYADQVLGKAGGRSPSASKNEKLEKEILDVIRRDGTRLDCCFKNIGVRKYAFNRIQLATYPRKFKPPKGTYYNTVLESASQT